MQWETVPAASIIGMIFTLLVSIGLPIILGIIVYKKTHAKISSCFIGAGVFVVFALILEQIFHAIILAVMGSSFRSRIFIFGLYAALAAALFEETGRLIAMKFFMKKSLDKGNALMYGVGHGGTESILIVGLTYVNNLLTTIMINTGAIEVTISQLEPAFQEATYQQLQQFWLSPSYHFYMAGVERASAIVLQLCLSVFVYKCVKTGHKKFLAGAFLLHFLVDFVTVVTAGLGLPIWAVEIEIIALVAIIAWWTVRICQKDEESDLFETY